MSYEAIWPGTDLIYTSERGSLKYSLALQPGADRARSRSVIGARRASGWLRMAAWWSVRRSAAFAKAPVTYQEIDGQRVYVGSSFVLQADGEPGTTVVGFDVASRDPTRPLIVDPPVIVYAG